MDETYFDRRNAVPGTWRYQDRLCLDYLLHLQILATVKVELLAL